MSFECLSVERDGPVVLVTINRPEVLNALNSQALGELRLVMLEAKGDPAVRAVIVTGSGERAFVAGADVGEVADLVGGHAADHARRGQQVFDLVEDLGKPVIAAINGYALGGGCELAMACTLRLAADTAKLGQPEIKLGIIPGHGGTQRLSRLVGAGRAMELVLTGRIIDAEEALRIGLVHRVVPRASLLQEARALAGSLAEGPSEAIRYAIRAVNGGSDMALPDALFLEATLFGLLAGTDDMREGTRAFLEKRKANFVNRKGE